MVKKSFDQVMAVLVERFQAPAASSKPTPWQALLFTLLSARTRDEQTEVVFQKLVARYPTVAALVAAKPAEVSSILQTIGLYRNKTKNVIALAKALEAHHGGQVPRDLDALVDLPGVGRKTASCVMVYSFHEPAIPVDTHVHRVSNRLGWVKTATPEKTELALRKVLPAKWWLDVNRVMVQFGRTICLPQRPRCWQCPVGRYCAFPKKTPNPGSGLES